MAKMPFYMYIWKQENQYTSLIFFFVLKQIRDAWMHKFNISSKCGKPGDLWEIFGFKSNNKKMYICETNLGSEGQN